LAAFFSARSCTLDFLSSTVMSSCNEGDCGSALLATSAGKSMFDSASEGAGEVVADTEPIDLRTRSQSRVSMMLVIKSNKRPGEGGLLKLHWMFTS
jgi:hypothetical protein